MTDEDELNVIMAMLEKNGKTKEAKTTGLCCTCNTALINHLEDNLYCPTCVVYLPVDGVSKSAFKKYRPIYNLYKIIRIYSGTSGIYCPTFVIDILKPVVINQPFAPDLVKKCKGLLKKQTIKNKNFLIVIAYCIINNRAVISISTEETRQVIAKFNRFLNHWATMRLQFARKNIIKYSWLLINLLKLIGVNGYDNVCVIKRRKELYQQIWNEIGNKIN